MTPKGQKQVTNAELDDLVPIVRATRKQESAVEIVRSLYQLLLNQGEDLEKAKKAKVKKRGKEEK